MLSLSVRSDPSVKDTNQEYLPSEIQLTLQALIDGARAALGDDLVSVILFGSGAEGRLRPTSDINTIFILRKFDPESVGKISDLLPAAVFAIRRNAMFLLKTELATASELFAVKFADIGRRHRVLFGKDVFAGLVIQRAAIISRVRQVLLNLILRLRADYLQNADFAQGLGALIADSAGPLRSSAATNLELEGRDFSSGREALQLVVVELGRPELLACLEQISAIREGSPLERPLARQIFSEVLEIAQALKERAKGLAA